MSNCLYLKHKKNKQEEIRIFYWVQQSYKKMKKNAWYNFKNKELNCVFQIARSIAKILAIKQQRKVYKVAKYY